MGDSKIQVIDYIGRDLPLWVVAFHRMARLGHSDGVLPRPFDGGHVMVRFYLDGKPPRFAPLVDAERAWLLYK